MKLLYKFITAIIVFTLSSIVLAQSDTTSTSSCNTGNPNNVGEHLLAWIFCGAEFGNQQPTMLGAMMYFLGLAATWYAIGVLGVMSIKFLYYTGKDSKWGGEGQNTVAGFMMLKSAVILFLTVPVVSNGFSISHVFAYKLIKSSNYMGDMEALHAARFLENEGGIFKVDLQNVEELTKYIVLAESCTAAMNVYSGVKITDAASYKDTVINVSPSSSADSVTLRWDYYYRDRATYSSPRSIDPSEEAFCGEIIINVPKQITSFGGLNGEVLMNSFDGQTMTLDPSITFLQPYADIFAKQYIAVVNHILNIRKIIAPLYLDIDQYANLLTLKSDLSLNPLDEDIKEAIRSTYSTADELASVVDRAYPVIGKLINNEMERYRAEIAAIGENAAQAASDVDGVIRHSCPENKLSLYDRCEVGKTWVEEIEDGGWILYPTYYWIMQKQNAKILELQSHFAAPSKTFPKSLDLEHDVTQNMLKVEAVKEIYNRGLNLYETLPKYLTDKSFSLDQSILIDQATSGAERKEKESFWGIGTMIRDTINNLLKKFSSAVTNLIVDDTGKADLLIKLVKIGTFLVLMGYSIATLLIGIWVASKFAAFAKIASKLATAASKVTGESNSGGSPTELIIKFMFMAMLLCFVMGFFLQIILPAIPIFKWGVEVLRWAITIYTFIVIIPIFMVYHITVNDDRLINEHTQSGWGMALEIVLRPTVLIIAFSGVMILMHVADIVIIMVSNFMTSMAMEVSGNAIGILIVILVLLFLAFHLVMRIFDVISTLADHVISKVNFGASPISPTDDGGSGRIIAAALIASKSVANLPMKLTKDSLSNRATTKA